MSGRKFDADKARMDLVSPIAINELAKVLAAGAAKYDAHNWRGGLKYSRVLAAILRHTLAYLGGESKDPETGFSHIAHVMCNAMFLLEFEVTKPDLDDRYSHSSDTSSVPSPCRPSSTSPTDSKN